MGDKQIELFIRQRFSGTRPALELFADLAAQSLQNPRKFA